MSAAFPPAAAPWAAALLAHLLGASLAGGLAVALVWLVLRLAPRLPPALRCALWWLACLKLVLALVWVRPLPLPLPLPAALAGRLPGVATASAFAGSAAPGRTGVGRLPGSTDRSVDAARSGDVLSGGRPANGPAWPQTGALLLLALWAAGLAAGLVRTARQLAQAGRIVRGARPLGSPALAARFAALAASVGLPRPPALAASPEVAAPLTIGPWRPTVVLPAGRELPSGELEMALCHELVHVRRGDLRLAWVPAAAARLFFFHPLAHLAAREYALAREAACDAEVLARLAAPPAAYARLLLALGAAGRRSTAAALGAAPSPGTLKRRLLMLDSTTRRPRAPWLWLAGLAAVAALVPVRIVAQPAAAPAAAPSIHHVARHVQSAHSTGEDYVLLSKDGGVTMSGSSAEIAHVRALAGPGGEVLWFRRAGREYVARDAALLHQARELFAPQEKLGAEQGELGARQGALGARQGALGAKQGALGAKLGSLAGREASGPDAAREELEREQDEVSRQMEDLGRQQEDLGRQQEELGRQQEELGRQQEKLAREAEARLKGLLDDALARGLAQEVR